uniref:Symplekin/Pta1 N-terminal domain-containing protein n=1 Tax=Eutreptiella gymnastica TaxID=73025 RepID=A0A6U7UIQ7_9EUGL|mmetsp:Transcript_124465/g.215726  ORF Transcript_124465/g.215726 Transcript_124465/m.215726 type:complete len:376 (+) Transcript_124465:92-1219(+)
MTDDVTAFERFLQSGAFLLETLKSTPASELEPNTIRACTNLFLVAYPLLYLNTELQDEIGVPFHATCLTPIRDIICRIDAATDVMFAYLMDFQVTAILLLTPRATPLVALNKNPKLPQIQVSSNALDQHVVQQIPAPFEPERLLNVCMGLIDEMVERLNKTPETSPTRTTTLITSLARIARFQPLFWPRLLPRMCDLAESQTGQTTLGSTSAKYMLHSSMIFLLRCPETARYRKQIQIALDKLTFEPGLLSNTHDQTLAAYNKSLNQISLEAERQRKEKQKRDALTEMPETRAKRARPSSSAQSNVQEVTAKVEAVPTVSEAQMNYLMLSLKALRDPDTIREKHQAGIIAIFKQMAALYKAPRAPPPRAPPPVEC